MDFTPGRHIGHLPPPVREYHDENTLFKVYDALREDVRLTEKQCRAAISAIQSRGIVFREKYEPELVNGTCRGGENGGSCDVTPVAITTPE